MTPTQVATEMAKIGIQNFASTNVDKGQYGALVAFHNSHGPVLAEFAITDFQPELKTEKLWYCSMGSGQAIVDPFLGLMRKVFWQDGPPSLQDGGFAVTWALTHAIEVNPGGVNDPIKIAILKDGKAKNLSEEEIQSHQANVDGAEQHLRIWAEIMNGSGKGKDAAPNIPEIKN